MVDFRIMPYAKKDFTYKLGAEKSILGVSEVKKLKLLMMTPCCAIRYCPLCTYIRNAWSVLTRV